ncbi:MAG: DUF559 domain-containing protein [Aureispira sp.]|nr:DUF559 domain-containing protein [Aureispira sp.]
MLRRRYTPAEKKLWEELLIAQKLEGYRFARQVPTLYYVADFLCKDLALIIEVDGSIHERPFVQERDRLRQKKLEGCGFRVLRFSNEEILNDLKAVHQQLIHWIETTKHPKW